MVKSILLKTFHYQFNQIMLNFYIKQFIYYSKTTHPNINLYFIYFHL